MSNFPDRLRLKEQAEEDLYFARRDRELIAALRSGRQRKSDFAPCHASNLPSTEHPASAQPSPTRASG